jgi:hypothetical protein
LLQHLVELVDDHVGELAGRILARDNGRDVIQFLRIGQAEDAAAVAGRKPDRLVVLTPVEQIGVAALLQEVGGDEALGDPGAEPARGCPAFGRDDRGGRLVDQCPLGGLVEHALPLGIGPAVAEHLVVTRPEGVHHLGAVAVDRGIDEHGGGQRELVEQFDHTPDPDAVAVVAPGVVQHIRLRSAGGKLGAEPCAEGEVFEIDAEIDGESLAARKVIDRALGDGGIAVAAMAGENGRN